MPIRGPKGEAIDLISPPRKPVVTIDPAEFVALRIIVQTLIASLAQAKGVDAQGLITALVADCQNAIRTALATDHPDPEKYRQQVSEAAKNILTEIDFSGSSGPVN